MDEKVSNYSPTPMEQLLQVYEVIESLAMNQVIRLGMNSTQLILAYSSYWVEQGLYDYSPDYCRQILHQFVMKMGQLPFLVDSKEYKLPLEQQDETRNCNTNIQSPNQFTINPFRFSFTRRT